MNVAKKQQIQELSTYINLLAERINYQNHKHTINQDHFFKGNLYRNLSKPLIQEAPILLVISTMVKLLPFYTSPEKTPSIFN